MHRVVITGFACISPLGNDLTGTWDAMLDGKSGIGGITHFDTEGFASAVAGEVKGFVPADHMDAKDAKRMDRFAQFGVAASKMALADAKLQVTPDNAADIAVMVGVGLGGIQSIESNHTKLIKSGPKRISPFFVPMMIANLAAGHVSIATGAKGANINTTTACASGLHAIGIAYTDLMLGRCKAAICGGTEATISPLGVGGFIAMKALSTRNESPDTASRPFHKDRDGFVMGEGSGVMILETLEHARERGASILGEVVGYGAAGDAYHMAAPPENGEGMALAMAAAIRESKLEPSRIQHVNCHATSTPVGDMCEVRALKTVFGGHASKLALTANKSQVGHLLGGAGGLEAVITAKTLLEQTVPPTINLDEPDPEFDLDCVTETRKLDMEHAICNSFGFGGTNCSVIFKRWEE